MFASAAATQSTLYTTNGASSANPSSPPRTSRFRGRNYLRNNATAPADAPAVRMGDRDELSTSPDTLAHRVRSGSSPAPPAANTTSRRQRRGLRQIASSEQRAATEPTGPSLTALQVAEGWLPTVDGSPGLRPTTQIQPVASTTAPEHIRANTSRRTQRANRSMNRHRAATAPYAAGLNTSVPESVYTRDFAALTEALAASTAALPTSSQQIDPAPLTIPIGKLPTIQFVAAQDPHSPRPSLHFAPISRTLPSPSSLIRVGRYSEKEGNPDIPPNVPSEAPIGFKSKVVSRRHCEFYYADSQWYIKDVKSSSGTFLNHIRLSQPGQESRPFPVKDGDVVQLGIDFKGGEEMIFRCVKMRIQCNRGWQKGINKFNKSAHKAIQELAKGASDKKSDAATKYSTECTICLNSIAPCQPLFVAPCSHTWHYKCIRPILEDPRHPHFQYPLFLCPNCRAVADLEADIEEPQPVDEPDVDGEATDDEGVNEDFSRLALSDEPADLTMLAGETFMESQIRNDDISSEMQQMTLLESMPEPTPRDFFLGGNLAPPQTKTPPTGLNPAASTFVPVSTTNTPSSSAQPDYYTHLANLGVGPSSTIRAKPSTSSTNSNNIPFTEDEIDSAHDSSESAPDAYPLLNVFPGWNFTRPTLEEVAAQRDIGFAADGPLTPRNTEGPFVFDGRGSGILDDEGNGDGVPNGDSEGRSRAAPA